MIAQLGRLLRMRLESLLDVFIREFLKAIIVRRGVPSAGQREMTGNDKCESGFHAVKGRERNDKRQMCIPLASRTIRDAVTV